MDLMQHYRGDTPPRKPDLKTPSAGGELGKELGLLSLPDSARVLTDQPEAFWTRQRAAIRSRIAVEQESRRPLKAFILASALSLAVLAGLLLKTSSGPVPATEPQTDPDQELLISVEQAIQNNGPEALAPAAVLAEEISASQAQSQHAPKENPYAN